MLYWTPKFVTQDGSFILWYSNNFSFSPFFSFFFFSEPRIQEILDFRHRITAENSDRFISTLVSVYKTWIFLAAIN